MAVLEIHQFSYTYPGKLKPVLNNINLSVEEGAFIVIIGKSGSGKSTLGKALAGFLFQDETPNFSGDILVNGIDMTQLPIYLASEKVAYVHQNPEDQFCTLTVQDEIAFGLENLCYDPEIIQQRTDETLRVVKGSGLKDRYLSTLSGGEKQKIAIASLLALEPDILILDEPTSNLDPIATQHVFETLYEIRKMRELTVIIIEHKLSQLIGFSPEIYEIDAGKIKRRSIDDIKQSRKNQPAINHKKVAQKTKPLISLSQVEVARSGKKILKGINLTLSPGEFVALIGPNGSGKSTLLETIMGFHAIQSGTCCLFDTERSKLKTSALVNSIGYIFQNPDHQLFTQSVWDEATFTSSNLELLNEDMKKSARDWLDKFGLSDRLADHPQRLSYGEKRRLNLIAVMLHDPRLLLIDELLIGQDYENAHHWMSMLFDYAQEGHTVFLVNHHAELTQAYCDRLVFLDEGEILVDQPTSTGFAALDRLGFATFLPLNWMESIYA